MAQQDVKEKVQVIKLAEREVIINKKAKPGTLCSLGSRSSSPKPGEKRTP